MNKTLRIRGGRRPFFCSRPFCTHVEAEPPLRSSRDLGKLPAFPLALPSPSKLPTPLRREERRKEKRIGVRQLLVMSSPHPPLPNPSLASSLITELTS